MNITTEYGYGMIVEELNLKPNFVPILMTHLITENRRKDYMDFCNNENLTPGEYETFEQYCDYAFCNYAYTLLSGLTIIFSEYNKLSEDNQFKCEDYCIYYPERIPEDENERNEILTKQQIRKMMTEFFSKIADNIPACENLTIKW